MMNFDVSTPVETVLDPEIQGRFIRIQALAINTRASLRIELIGCASGEITGERGRSGRGVVGKGWWGGGGVVGGDCFGGCNDHIIS